MAEEFPETRIVEMVFPNHTAWNHWQLEPTT